MLTAIQLKSAGYQKYPERFKEYATYMYKKCFDDTEGEKYYLRFYEYPPLPNEIENRYSSEAQFKDRCGNTFNVECLTNDSLEQVEEFFERVWVNCGCEHYERFGE